MARCQVARSWEAVGVGDRNGLSVNGLNPAVSQAFVFDLEA